MSTILKQVIGVTFSFLFFVNYTYPTNVVRVRVKGEGVAKIKLSKGTVKVKSDLNRLKSNLETISTYDYVLGKKASDQNADNITNMQWFNGLNKF